MSTGELSDLSQKAGKYIDPDNEKNIEYWYSPKYIKNYLITSKWGA